MNKRTRLIVSLLFAVVIILAAAITRFYVNVPKNSAVNGGEGIERIIASDGSGYTIFADSSGGCGIAEAGRITAAPEWDSLRFAENDRCIASKKIGGREKFGCIDFEGNVVVPLIYGSIEKRSSGGVALYRACSDEDGSYVLYDSRFVPQFSVPWTVCDFSDGELLLENDGISCVYTYGSEGLLFKSAAVSGNILNRTYELNIYSRVLLSKLTPAMIEKMTEFTESYIEYAFTGDETYMNAFDADIRRFETLFPHSEEITARRLLGVPEVHIYNVGSENGVPLYEVSVSADTEIFHKNEADISESMRDVIKASVIFRGSSEHNIEAVSGAFEIRYPEYTVEETTAAPSDKSGDGGDY